MEEASKRAGELHSDWETQRNVGGFIVTEGNYRPSLKISRHDHELASVCVVLRGGYEEGFGRRQRRGDPGVVIVHPEGEHHDQIHDPARVQLLTVEIAGDLLQVLKPELRALNEAWHRTDFGVAALAYKLCYEIGRSDRTSALVIESTTLDLLDLVGCVQLPNQGRAAWLSRVRDLLETQFQNAPTMDEISKVAGVHPVYLARAFRKRFGCSVGSYVRRLQVGKAASLLNDSEISLSAVAYEAGFSDQSHMTRLLRAHTGLTPGAWRRRVN